MPKPRRPGPRTERKGSDRLTIRSITRLSMHSRLIAGAMAVAVTLGVALPAVARTHSGTAGANFCTNIDSTTSQVTTRMGDVDTKIVDFKGTRSAKKTDRWASQDTKLTTARTTGDTKRNDGYAKLDAKAMTTEQHAAVTTFQSTVEAAVTTRNTAIDAAVQAYRGGADVAIESFTTNLDAAHTTFESAVDAAVA